MGLYEEKKFNSDNLDLLFKNNKAIIYNNVKYFDNKIISTADEVEFDLIKGDINIKMFDFYGFLIAPLLSRTFSTTPKPLWFPYCLKTFMFMYAGGGPAPPPKIPMRASWTKNAEFKNRRESKARETGTGTGFNRRSLS